MEKSLANYLVSKKGYIENIARRYGIITDAEDIFQDVSLILVNKAETFSGNSKFDTFIYRIAANAALARLRSNKRMNNMLEKIVPQCLETIEEQYCRAEMVHKLRELSSSNGHYGLNENDHSVLELEIMLIGNGEHASQERFAELLQAPISVSKGRRFRARQKLRKIFKKYF